MRDYLEGTNLHYARQDWPLTCIQFAPYAPEQNPIEHVWLRAKQYIRHQWHRCQDTFQSVTDLFEEAINTISFNFPKLRMYLPDLEPN